MVRVFAILFGIALIFAGVAGYLPNFMTDGLLFGYFEVDSTHNIVHLATGVIAIMAATNVKYAKLFFKVFGLVYLVIAALGYWRDGDLFMMHVNMADNILHLVIGIVACYLGFFVKSDAV